MGGLEGYNLSRRDDLESLGYTIMCLIDKTSVPWMTMDNKQAILEAKREFKTSESCSMKFRGIRKFIVKASELEFKEEPDYETFH